MDPTAVPLEAPPEAHRRLRRLRALAWTLDAALPLAGRWRVGLDPLIGLVPGVGDWAGAAISLYVIHEAARLGLPWRVLTRMAGNILVEAVVGVVPVAGDVFDVVWQANLRNLRLIDRHYRAGMRTRSLRDIAAALVAFAVVLLGLAALGMWLAWRALAALLG